MEQRLARDRRLAMELLVEQTYRFPDKPPKNVAGLIDRASLLAFYRVHNAGLATEAKVEEILSGYRGRTHVLALMLAKKYGKKLVERLQSTPRSPASTVRMGRALRPVNSRRDSGTKRKSAPPLLRRACALCYVASREPPPSPARLGPATRRPVHGNGRGGPEAVVWNRRARRSSRAASADQRRTLRRQQFRLAASMAARPDAADARLPRTRRLTPAASGQSVQAEPVR